jgi:CheY-like chemotaxis protein
LNDALVPVSISRSILVAEDHPDSRDALRTLLEACGYQVFVAGDGAEAVQRAVETHPDLILMDLMMPGVDGMEATRRLRGESDFQDVPIVALTAMEGGRERALDAGFDDFVSKPINLPSFLRKLESWLSPPPDAVAG